MYMIILFGRALFAESVHEAVIESILLVIAIIFGISLIRSVLHEMMQREKIEELEKRLHIDQVKKRRSCERRLYLQRDLPYYMDSVRYRDKSAGLIFELVDSLDSTLPAFLTVFALTRTSVIFSPSRTALHFDIIYLL